ncbi:MAG: M20/M25/M40 family metallo-hydrolase [Candidatus Thorarchaeota archaeon]|jgi:putative aminopeptidase FrvX
MQKILAGLAIGLSLVLVGVVVLKVQPSPPPKPIIQEPIVTPPVIPPAPPVYTFNDALDSIKSDVLKKNLYYLASDELEGRMSGKKGNVTAADWIKKEFESYGLKTMYDKFSIRRLNSGPNNEQGDAFTQNIYGYIEGTDPTLKNEVIVVGAHMDHIGYGPSMSRSRQRNKIHPGADDNASGTVALLAIAKAFSMVQKDVKRTIVFQAYSGEEMGLIGSRHYVNEPLFPIDNPSIRSHKFMLNLDMVGWLGKGTYFTGFNSGESSADIGRIISELNNKYTFANRITSRRSGGSDHANFYNKRIPVAFLHTGGHPHYHTPSDTADKINYDGIERVAKYAFELAWKVTQDGGSPRFNEASFKPMPLVHDHGHPEVPFTTPYHLHEEVKK